MARAELISPYKGQPEAARTTGSNVSASGDFRFDEIGRWSELKLEIIEKYGAAYTTAFSDRGKRLEKYYIDAFSGAGVHLSKETGRQIEGSPARALRVRPAFDHFYFIDLNPEKTAYLKSLCADRKDVDVITDGPASIYLTQKLLPNIRYDKFNRALCLLDPYGLHLDWEVMRQAGQSRAVDVFLELSCHGHEIATQSGEVLKSAPQEGIERMHNQVLG